MRIISQDPIYTSPIQIIGLNHRTLGLEQREMLARDQGWQKVLEQVRRAERVEEAAVISTCNRFEVLAVGSNHSAPILEIIKAELGSPVAQHSFYALQNAAALRHFFRVASSLDSMVLGEPQILGQVKEAYERACKNGAAGKFLHHLFQFAFSLAKRVRSNTSIAERGVSLSFIAVKLAQKIFGELSGKHVLIIGSGRMAELSALHLRSYGCVNITVANRTVERATALASRIAGGAISLDEVPSHLERSDIVISSLSQVDQPLIELGYFNHNPRSSPLLLIDLGVPRNLPPQLKDIDDVYLYNIDDLEGVAEENQTIRAEAAKDAEVLIDYGVLQFERWLIKVAAEPVILDFRARVQAACQSELRRALSRHLSPEHLSEVLPNLSLRLSGKLSHDLTQIIEQLQPGQFDAEAFLPLLFDEMLKVA